MKSRPDYFAGLVVILIGIAVVLAGGIDPGNQKRRPDVADTIPEQRRPDIGPPFPDDVELEPLRPPSFNDPLYSVLFDPKRVDTVATAFSVASGGVWLTALHATVPCDELFIQTGRKLLPVLRVIRHSQADVAVIFTPGGAPPLASESALSRNQAGYHFGYPNGVPGGVYSLLLYRTRMRAYGAREFIEPTIEWAEVRRFPRVETLGGMSGGPVLDKSGRFVGVFVASSRRRGRLTSTAPVSIREVLDQANITPILNADGDAGAALNPRDFPHHGDALHGADTIAEVLCNIEKPNRWWRRLF